ncbi:hypothetical protein AQUCO_00600022v1 [Aquilegia coerulea]|uniref:Uncharacterized protein n=1 Tax=Aquilegia coerulea TaxID=218851 RepID=A0A2G5EML1_AQUCA|nr:hypothetical protein AQUCO_00600022v1 [Aquilegia coerulea]
MLPSSGVGVLNPVNVEYGAVYGQAISMMRPCEASHITPEQWQMTMYELQMHVAPGNSQCIPHQQQAYMLRVANPLQWQLHRKILQQHNQQHQHPFDSSHDNATWNMIIPQNIPVDSSHVNGLSNVSGNQGAEKGKQVVHLIQGVDLFSGSDSNPVQSGKPVVASQPSNQGTTKAFHLQIKRCECLLLAITVKVKCF